MSDLIANASVVTPRRLVPFWSDLRACYLWRLETCSTHGFWHNEGKRGDIRWATAIAQHYGIAVPEAPSV